MAGGTESDSDDSLSTDGLDAVDGPSLSSQTTLASDRMLEYAAKLESAICSGNADVAAEMAELLAQAKAAITAQGPAVPTEADISVKICVEDKEMSAGHMVFRLQPTITIQALKWKMYEKYDFPPDVQKWIIGRRVASDFETLAECGVTEDDSVVYLYLLTPTVYQHEVAALTNRTDWQLGYLNHFATVSSEYNTGASTGLTRTPGSSTRLARTPSPPTPAPVLEVVRSSGDCGWETAGWQCPSCTFLNEPTRPGCEICAADRPTDYKPPTGYQPSERERRRIAEENKLADVSHWPNATVYSVLDDMIDVLRFAAIDHTDSSVTVENADNNTVDDTEASHGT